jgi:hypothetical protein
MIPQHCNMVMMLVLLLLAVVSFTNAFQSSSSFMGSSVVLSAAAQTFEGRSTMTMEYIRKCSTYPVANWLMLNDRDGGGDHSCDLNLIMSD